MRDTRSGDGPQIGEGEMNECRDCYNEVSPSDTYCEECEERFQYREHMAIQGCL